MESMDLIKRPASSDSGHENENNDPCDSGCEDSLPLNNEVKEEIGGEVVGTVTHNPFESGVETTEADLLPLNSEVRDEINREAPGSISDGLDEDMDISEEDAVNNTPSMAVNFEFSESVSVVNAVTSTCSVNTENESLAIQSEDILSNHKKNGTLASIREIGTGPLSGAKRPRLTVEEHQPSVRVIFNSLTRESKRKLEELLHQWSQWHAESSSSSNDPHTVLVSGEETYFPALRVGLDKASAVTFWVDDQTKTQTSKEFVPLDGTSVPFYDRGYSSALCLGDGSSSLDGEVEKFESSRCFNCGSYSHALKDCPKPRDSVAVNNARKQHKSRRNQHANSRNSTRYYQSSRGGKYDGLMPGVLDPETRQLLGLGELDPPPWLQRMREIGYPPGYLEEEEDQPSGITIFGEEENKEESEEGEILDASHREPSRKMSVEYPGINAPIPEKADKRLWAVGSSSYNLSKDHPHQRYNHSSENVSRGHYHEPSRSRDLEDERPPGCDTGVRSHHRYSYSSENAGRGHYHEPRWSRDIEDNGPPSSDSGNRSQHRYHYSYEDHSRGRYHEPRRSRDLEDDGPPGCDAGTSPSLSYHFRRHGDHESGYSSSLSPRATIPRSPYFGRSLSERGRRSPLIHDGTPNYDQAGTFPYSSPR